LAIAAALVAAVPVTFVALTNAEAAVTGNTIPITISNNSGRTDPVYLYNLGTLLTTGQQGWADAAGNFHAWAGGGNPPTPAPDASIVGPTNGQSLTIQLPKFSGRMYFSYGQKLDFRLTTGGLVQPAVQNPADPNRNILFNWTEYTLNNDGIWINSTQVDFFSAPYAVSVLTGAGSTLTTGHLKSGGYDGFFNALRAAPGGYGGLIQTRSDGSIIRALNPGHGIEGGLIPATAMQNYIDRVWSRYSTTSLSVTPFTDQPGIVYTGRVSGNVMNFTNSSGAVVTSFQKPDSDSVFGCYKLLDAPNDLVRGPISRTLCAGFNRTTLLTSANQPYNVPSAFYQDAVTNQYAKAVHAQMADGKAYAFAFDDVGNNESLVHDGSPRSAGIILDPFTGGGGTTPPTSPPPTSPTTPPTTTPPGTFAPTRYLQSAGTLPSTTGAAASVSLVAANGNHDGTPTNAKTFTATGLTGRYSGAATTFDLALDSAGVGNGIQARVSYDLTGNGSWDRVETYRYFPTDPVTGWEHYTQAQGLASATGTLGNLANGQVKVEVWSAIGGSTSTIGAGNLSKVVLPFS
jgi:hypothetical protein